MPRKLELRAFREGEEEKLHQISRSRTGPQRAVERAQIVLLLSEGKRVEDIAQAVGRTQATVYYQVHQFNDRGLAFVEDLPREGRPLVYDEQQRGEIVKAAKTNPQHLDLELGHWTLDWLVTYVNQTLGIAISRSQLGDVLKQEGLKWYQEKTYFSESPDPQFVEKRGRL
jgi:transposase